MGGTPRAACDPARCPLRARPPCISVGGFSSGIHHPPKSASPRRTVHVFGCSQKSYSPRQGQLNASEQAKPVSPLRARSCEAIPQRVSQRPVVLTQKSTASALPRSSSDRRPLATACEKQGQGQGRCHSAPVLRQAESSSARPKLDETTAPRPCMPCRVLRLPSPRRLPPQALPAKSCRNLPQPQAADRAATAAVLCGFKGKAPPVSRTPEPGPLAALAMRPGSRSPKATKATKATAKAEPPTNRTAEAQGTPGGPPQNTGRLTGTLSPKGCRETTASQKPFGSPRMLEASEIQKTVHIGSGSFGSVWKAIVRGHSVAVKICQQTTADERRGTLKELGFLCNLHHPRLVSFLGFAQTADQLIFVMELMTGGNLSDLLFCRRPVLSFRQKALMGCQVAEGLSFLHERHVIHRDLKTMNVVLDASLNCKLCDFGLTLYLDPDTTHMTVCGLQGSPRYMAPEQLQTETNNVRISEKVDIWQMGCVMLELFCAVVPFSSLSNVAAIISEVRDAGCTVLVSLSLGTLVFCMQS